MISQVHGPRKFNHGVQTNDTILLRLPLYEECGFDVKGTQTPSRRIIILDRFPSVGLSPGTSVICGSMYSSTTSRALGLWDFSLEPPSDMAFIFSSSLGFQVNIQRHLRICSGPSLERRILDTVPVFNQLWISASLASAQAFCSGGVNMVSLTSVLCFFSVAASSISSWDHSPGFPVPSSSADLAHNARHMGSRLDPLSIVHSRNTASAS